MTVQTVPCPVCKRSTSFTFPGDQYAEWMAGKDAADAFTGLSEPEAWLLVSGVHPGCWNEFMLADPMRKPVVSRPVGVKPSSIVIGATNVG